MIQYDFNVVEEIGFNLLGLNAMPNGFDTVQQHSCRD